MQNFLDQLPALIGVVLGAAGALAATTWADRLRWHREQAVRWDQRRLDSYMAFATTLKEIQSLAFRLTAIHRPGSSIHPLEREAGLELLTQATLRRTQDWESMLLLGDEETVAAAGRWRRAGAVVEHIARREVWDDITRWQAAVDDVDRARDDFYVAARRGLGVNSGSVQQYSNLRSRTNTL